MTNSSIEEAKKLIILTNKMEEAKNNDNIGEFFSIDKELSSHYFHLEDLIEKLNDLGTDEADQLVTELNDSKYLYFKLRQSEGLPGEIMIADEKTNLAKDNMEDVIDMYESVEANEEIGKWLSNLDIFDTLVAAIALLVFIYIIYQYFSKNHHD